MTLAGETKDAQDKGKQKDKEKKNTHFNPKDKQYWEGRIWHVPKFALGYNGVITFSIFMRVCQIDAKGQIITKEENY